jgi:predicted transcriptional regulator of viral defense system
MTFIEFKDKMFDLACFNIHNVYAWYDNFDRNNFTRWVKKGYLIRLRNGYFTFPEYKNVPDFSFYIANRIYKPSYISLHSSLSFYGLVPESVIQTTSVTTLKTSSFENELGSYSYKNIKDSLMFGYDLKPMADNRNILFASPEKALLDLLYLYPFYNNEEELTDLRLDEDYLQNDLNKTLLMNYCSKFENKALEKRVKLLLNIYDI